MSKRAFLFGLAVVAVILLYCLLSLFFSAQDRGVAGNIFIRFMPVWLAMIIVFLASITFRAKLGL